MAAQALAAGAAAGAAGKAAENAPKISKAVTDYQGKQAGIQSAKLDIQKRQVKFFGSIILVVVGGVIMWRLGKSLVKMLSEATSNEIGGGLSQIMNTQTNDGSTQPTINITQAKALADGQYSGMAYWGKTDFGPMYNALSGLNGKDLQMVAQQFGKRNKGTFKVEAYNIFQWYQDELSIGELQKMRDLWYKSGLSF
jgi:hypothetical protein